MHGEVLVGEWGGGVSRSDHELLEVLDGDRAAGERALSSPNAADAAEQAFVSGLLAEVHANESLDARLAIVFARVPIARKSPWRFAAMWVAAAAAVAFVLIWSSDSRLSALERVVARAAREVDRAYRMSMWHADDQPREAQVFTGVGERFALSFPRGGRGDLWFGFDGETSWFVPANQDAPVLTGSSRDAVQRWLRARGLRYPMLRIPELLERVRNGPWREHAEIAADTLYIVAHPPRVHRASPVSVVLVADRATGLLRRIELEWGADAPRATPSRCVLELVSEQDLGDGFFGHDAHHAPGRIVRRIDEKR